ncbi:MAG: amidohydrolase family protein [Myxococcota bacterium]
MSERHRRLSFLGLTRRQGLAAAARSWVGGPAAVASAQPRRPPLPRGKPTPPPPQPPSLPPPEPVALVGGTLIGEDGKALRDAVVVTDDAGRIVFAGPAASRPAASPGATPPRTVDVTGQTITGGLCDPLTQIGIIEVSLEKSTSDRAALDEEDPIVAAFRAADGYNPASSLVAIARQQGLTSAGVIPGGAGLVTGQSAWVDLHGTAPDDTLGREVLALHVGIDDGAYGSYRGRRANAWLRLRELIDDTRAYLKNPAGYDRRQLRTLPHKSRLDLRATARALRGEVPVVIHVDRASDLLTALRVAKAEGLRLVLASAAEGWKVADAIAKAEVPVVVYPLDHGPRSFAALGAREDNAARLHAAGVRIALSTGSSHDARKLRQTAGNAVRAGLPQPAGVAAIVEGPARAFGVDDDYGAPRAGRRANLVVWSGDPLELSSRVVRMFVRGRPASLRSRQTALFERYR